MGSLHLLSNGQRSSRLPFGDVWVLWKGDWESRCEVRSHSLGWELSLASGSHVVRSAICHDEHRAFYIANVWRRDLESKGWRVYRANRDSGISNHAKIRSFGRATARLRNRSAPEIAGLHRSVVLPFG